MKLYGKRLCIVCGTDITGRGWNAKYCEDCVKDNYQSRALKYQANRCKRRRTVKKCGICGGSFVGANGTTKYCGKCQCYTITIKGKDRTKRILAQIKHDKRIDEYNELIQELRSPYFAWRFA